MLGGLDVLGALRPRMRANASNAATGNAALLVNGMRSAAGERISKRTRLQHAGPHQTAFFRVVNAAHPSPAPFRRAHPRGSRAIGRGGSALPGSMLAAEHAGCRHL